MARLVSGPVSRGQAPEQRGSVHYDGLTPRLSTAVEEPLSLGWRLPFRGPPGSPSGLLYSPETASPTGAHASPGVLTGISAEKLDRKNPQWLVQFERLDDGFDDYWSEVRKRR